MRTTTVVRWWRAVGPLLLCLGLASCDETLADGMAEDASTGPEDKCRICHGNPPPAPGHPVALPGLGLCYACHPETVDRATGQINLAVGAHMNGSVDYRFPACNSCHGAPPSTPHPDDGDCTKCHGCVVNETGELDPAYLYLHMNGEINVESPPACPPLE